MCIYSYIYILFPPMEDTYHLKIEIYISKNILLNILIIICRIT